MIRILAFLVLLVSLAHPTQAQTLDQQVNALRALVSNNTVMTYDNSHGTQVEYFSSNGRSYLFYPGNTAIVRGDWLVSRQGNAFAQICFQYPSAGLQCIPAQLFTPRVVETMSGDPLGLSRSQNTPFVLQKGRTTLNALINR